jgi:hypothetical protein
MAWQNKSGVTFLEIVVAVAIMAVAMIPLFGLMTGSTVDTERNASQAFAINKATEILNTLIDSAPFAAIRQGNPGFLRTDDLKSPEFKNYNDAWARKIAKMLFPGTSKEGSGYPCRGIITDARGIHYLVHLKVEDVPSVGNASKPDKVNIGTGFPDGKPVNFPESKDLTFAYLKNPEIISDGEWTQSYKTPSEGGKPIHELDLGNGSTGVAEPPDNVYKDEGMAGLPADSAKFVNPTGIRYSQQIVTEKVPYDAADEFAHCCMKRLIVQIQWNLDQKLFKKPEEKSGNTQRIHLMTIKGDI